MKYEEANRFVLEQEGDFERRLVDGDPRAVVNVIEALGLGYHIGNAVKYIARAGKKPGNTEVQDLREARWYIDRRIELLSEGRNVV